MDNARASSATGSLRTRLLICAAGFALAGSTAWGQATGNLFSFWRSRLGTNQTTTYNGMKIVLTPTGSVAVTRISDGQRAIFAADGTERYDYTDGRVLFKFPDGKQTLTLPSGTRQVVWPTGNRSTYYVDGREEHTLTDGRFIVRTPTGPISQTETRPNGIKIWFYRTGMKVWFFPNGVKKTYMPDGTVLTGTWGAGGGSGGGGSGGPTITAPSAPNALQITANPGGGLALTWADQSGNEQAFVIERDPPFNGSAQIHVAPNVTTYTDTTAAPTAEYRVAASNEGGMSPFTPWAGLVIEPGEFPVLVPGSGFGGPTEQPAAVGSPEMAGYDAKAIARWDVVPYQTFDGDFHIGVVAFHMNGIDRVSFSVEGGPWTDVHEMKLNPQSGVYEYTATLRASDFADGAVEVRAIAWPEGAGEPRVLGGEYDLTKSYLGTEWTGDYSLTLFANAGGTLTEQVVELQAGDYTWGVAPLYFGSQADHTRWLTYRPAPGVSPESVRITGSVAQVPAQRNFSKIRLQDVTLLVTPTMLSWFNNANSKMLWMDRVRVVGTGQFNTVGGSISVPHQWWTDSTVSDTRDGIGRQFVRGCRFERIGEDVIKVHTAINCVIDDVNPGPNSATYHSGVIANPIVHDNRIYYGLEMVNLANGVVAWPLRNGTDGHWENHDVAIVNCHTDGPNDGVTHVWFVGASTNHLLVQDSTFDGRADWRLGSGIPAYFVFQPHNVVLKDTVWTGAAAAYPYPHPMPGVTIVTNP